MLDEPQIELTKFIDRFDLDKDKIIESLQHSLGLATVLFYTSGLYSFVITRDVLSKRDNLWRTITDVFTQEECFFIQFGEPRTNPLATDDESLPEIQKQHEEACSLRR